MSEAVRLAAILEDEKMHSMAIDTEAAAELRRLHAENEALKVELHEQARVNGMGSEREARLMTLNAELVEALRDLEWAASGVEYMESEYANELNKARAALAKVEASK